MRVVEDSGGHGWHVLSYRTSCVRVSAQSRAKRCKDRVVRTEAAEARMQSVSGDGSGESSQEWRLVLAEPVRCAGARATATAAK